MADVGDVAVDCIALRSILNQQVKEGNFAQTICVQLRICTEKERPPLAPAPNSPNLS
jgi:hypothetical protein